MLIGFKETLTGLDAVKPVIGDVRLTLGHWGVSISGRVQTLLKLTCDRCLRAYFLSLNVDIDEKLVHDFDKGSHRRDRELLKKDFVEVIPADGVLDISDIVYQAVTLAAPTYCLCGSDCPGPSGSQRDSDGLSLAGDKKEAEKADPRWKNLKTLFPKEDSGEIS